MPEDNLGDDGLGSESEFEELLAGFPGAALIAELDGTVVGANAKGAGLEALLRHSAVPEIVSLMDDAAANRAIAVGTVKLAGAKGDVILEVSVVPTGGRLMVLARDQTMERNLRTALVESRQRYKDLVEVSSDFAWEVGPEGTFVFVSPKGALGFPAEKLIGRRPQEFVVDPSDFDPLPFIADAPLSDVEMWMRRADGGNACVMTSSVPLRNEEDEWQGVRGVCRDVTQEREHEAALSRARQREQLLNYIVSTIRDELDPENILKAAASATARGLGAASCRIFRIGRKGKLTLAAEHGDIKGIKVPEDVLDHLADEAESKTIDDGYWQILATATRYHQSVNGAILLWKGTDKGYWDDDNRILIGDVSNQLGIAIEQIANHEHIVKMSRTDSMTGMLNRRAFFEQELPRRLARLERSGKCAALLYVDMDNFKKVNDVHGHQAGDDAILYLRDMLLEFCRPGDEMARLGGDEFAVWLDGIPADVVPARTQTLIDMSRSMVKFSGHPDFPLGISVGVAIYDPKVGEPLDNLIARSDAAMYAIKKAGKGGFIMAPPPGTKVELPDDAKKKAAK